MMGHPLIQRLNPQLKHRKTFRVRLCSRQGKSNLQEEYIQKLVVTNHF